MFRALARFFVVLISFWAIAVALKWSTTLALVIGGLLGFALAEATGLFGLVVALIILFVF